VTSTRGNGWWVVASLAVAAAGCAATAAAPGPVRAAASHRLGEHPAIYTVSVRDRRLVELVEDSSGEGAPIAPSWSGDGRWLVFARLPCDGCAPEIRKLSRSRPRKSGLGPVIANGLVPNVSASGSVVFLGLDYGVLTMRLDGSGRRRVLTPGQAAPGVDQPHLSPDGRRIAFIRRDVRGRGWIEKIRIDGSGRHRLTRTGAFADPTWSPDGRRLAFARQERSLMWRICVMKSDGSGLRVIGRPGHSDSYPTWSPDGKRLAFVRQLRFGHAIYAINLDGTGTRRLTPASLDAIEPAWSPRGDEIAFVVNGEGD
jgi:Tol biopolymer transport system component